MKYIHGHITRLTSVHLNIYRRATHKTSPDQTRPDHVIRRITLFKVNNSLHIRNRSVNTLFIAEFYNNTMNIFLTAFTKLYDYDHEGQLFFLIHKYSTNPLILFTGDSPITYLDKSR